LLHAGNNETVNKEMYIDILLRLRDAVRRKRPEKCRTNNSFLLYDNAPAHRPVLFNDFLAKKNVTKLENPPYTRDLFPGDFYLFPQLKSALKGWHFCGAADVINNAMVELKRLSKYGFQKCFQHPYSHWKKYIVAQGGHFEINVA
jgi:hypothetical protein